MDIREYVAEHSADFFAGLAPWLAIPSVPADLDRHGDVRASAPWLGPPFEPTAAESAAYLWQELAAIPGPGLAGG